MRATVPARQLVSLSESWHEGWRVTVDGQPRPLVRVYGDFIGAVVEAGDRDVAFRFQPWSFRVGAWMSAVGLGLMIGDLLFTLWRRGRGVSVTPPREAQSVRP